MKFSEDFDKYARDVLHINNPFKDWFKRLEKTFLKLKMELLLQIQKNQRKQTKKQE